MTVPTLMAYILQHQSLSLKTIEFERAISWYLTNSCSFSFFDFLAFCLSIGTNFEQSFLYIFFFWVCSPSLFSRSKVFYISCNILRVPCLKGTRLIIVLCQDWDMYHSSLLGKSVFFVLCNMFEASWDCYWKDKGIWEIISTLGAFAMLLLLG